MYDFSKNLLPSHLNLIVAFLLAYNFSKKINEKYLKLVNTFHNWAK